MIVEKVRKNIKHFILSIKPDGRVIFSIPLYAKEEEADFFLQNHEKWLNDKYEKAVDRTVFYRAADGEEIHILGNSYTIRIVIGNQENVKMIDGILNLEVKENNNEKISKILEKYLSALRKKVYQEILNKYLEISGLTINSLKIKKMYRANGICYPGKKEIVLSTTLIHKPLDFIEAICLHEVAHLKYPNHQKDFYAFIYSIMPDYNDRVKHLTNK